MATYVSALAPNGIVLMHVSNRHLELSSVVAGIAQANGLVSRVNNRAAHDDEDDSKYIFTSTVVISARAEGDFGVLLQDEDWQEVDVDPAQRVWTDDYSNVIGAVIRQYRKDNEPDVDEPTEPQPAVPAPVPAPAPTQEAPSKEPGKP